MTERPSLRPLSTLSKTLRANVRYHNERGAWWYYPGTQRVTQPKWTRDLEELAATGLQPLFLDLSYTQFKASAVAELLNSPHTKAFQQVEVNDTKIAPKVLVDWLHTGALHNVVALTLYQQKLNPDVYTALETLSFPKLRTLDLRNNKLTKSVAKLIDNSKRPDLRALSLGTSTTTDLARGEKESKVIVNALCSLKGTNSLRELTLQSLKSRDDLLLPLLRHDLLHALEHLNLPYAWLSENEWNTLGDALSNAAISSLDLRYSYRAGTQRYSREHFAATARFDAVRTLKLTSCDLLPDEFVALANNPTLRDLDHLDLAQNRDLGPALSALASSAMQLTSLSLEGVQATPETLHEIGTSRVGRFVEKLDLSFVKLGAEGAAKVFAQGSFPALKHVSLIDAHIGNAGVRALFDAGRPLETVQLMLNSIDAEGATFIAQHPATEKLWKLSLSNNPLGEQGAMALAQSPMLQQLREFNLQHTGVTEAAGHTFAARRAFAPGTMLYLIGYQEKDMGQSARNALEEAGYWAG